MHHNTPNPSGPYIGHKVEVPNVSSSATAILPIKPPAERLPFPHNLPYVLDIVLSQHGIAYSRRQDVGNAFVLPVGSKQLNRLIRSLASEHGVQLRKADLAELNGHLQAHAEAAGRTVEVWFRVAPHEGGVAIDLGDETHARVVITPGNVEVVHSGCTTLFYRSPVMRPLPMPAERGDAFLLKKYVNVDACTLTLLIAWLSYTLAHPKAPSTKYVILVIKGNQGSGKTLLCNVILKLLDASAVGVQALPTNPKDLAIAVQHAHVLCFDNVRDFRQSMADMLCIGSTGGAISTRQLYTDSEQHVMRLHGACVLNGIHSFIDQPDLAQRCLPIEMRPLDDSHRKSEAEFMKDFESDAPRIIRGLFDLIAGVLAARPAAEVTNPERMLDFVVWLAAMEKAQGVPSGVLQSAYSAALNEGQLDSLLDNPLAAAVLEFAQKQTAGIWWGTPAELFEELNRLVPRFTQRSREWPHNAISLSKRLASLQGGLVTQGVHLTFSRGKHRQISIELKGDNDE